MITILLLLYVTTLVYLSITERFRHYAALVAAQGWILFAVALLRLKGAEPAEMLFVVSETLLFKALLVPYILYRIIRKTKVDRIAAAGTSQCNALLGSMAAMVVSVLVTRYLSGGPFDTVFFCVALYGLLSGLLLIVNRRRIFSHLVGFLVIENAVFLFSTAIGSHMPYLVNLAVLLDLMLSVMMLGIFLSRLGEHMHIADADRLTTLKD